VVACSPTVCEELAPPQVQAAEIISTGDRAADTRCPQSAAPPWYPDDLAPGKILRQKAYKDEYNAFNVSTLAPQAQLAPYPRSEAQFCEITTYNATFGPTGQRPIRSEDHECTAC
jgi:hypothetical protein